MRKFEICLVSRTWFDCVPNNGWPWFSLMNDLDAIKTENQRSRTLDGTWFKLPELECLLSLSLVSTDLKTLECFLSVRLNRKFADYNYNFTHFAHRTSRNDFKRKPCKIMIIAYSFLMPHWVFCIFKSPSIQCVFERFNRINSFQLVNSIWLTWLRSRG